MSESTLSDTRTAPALLVKDLGVNLQVGGRSLNATQEVSFELQPGRIHGLVGESGSGKSLTALALMGLLPPGSTTDGVAELQDMDLLHLPPRTRRSLNGRRLAMVFQEPMTALHPMLTVGRQMTEGARVHLGVSRQQANEKAIEMLERVGIPNPRAAMRAHVHELSGGMRQRVMIAMMLVCEPEIIIADEPTTALDVTIQAQILDLLRDLVDETGVALLLITHDLGVVAEYCDGLTVMYAGHVVESGETRRVLQRPQHPYTERLLAARPSREQGQERLRTIPGRVPTLDKMPSGCRFAERCPRSQEKCSTLPPLEPHAEGLVRCWFPLGEAKADD